LVRLAEANRSANLVAIPARRRGERKEPGVADRSARAASLGRVGTSPTLGEYDEYPEPWPHSLLIIGLWLGIAIALVVLLSQPSAGCEDVRGRTDCWQIGAGLNPASLVAFIPAAVLIWRRLFSNPGVRLGEFGLEDRTSALTMFGPDLVLWREVASMNPSRSHFYGRIVDLVVDAPENGGSKTVVSVRLNGLSATPAEIEAEMTNKLAQARSGGEPGAASPIVDRGRPLPGIRVQTDKGEPMETVTSGALLDLFDRMAIGSFLIMDAPASGDPERYIQTARDATETWHVEYRDGGPDRHYGAECHDVSVLGDVFLSWADGSRDWRERLAWEQMKLA
jgi:hypothetical protein